MWEQLRPSEVINQQEDEYCQIIQNDEEVDQLCGLDHHKIGREGLLALIDGKPLYFDDGEYAHLIYYDNTQNKKIGKGHWIETEDKRHYFCSECLKQASIEFDDFTWHYNDYLSDFCPSCGADMRKEH